MIEIDIFKRNQLNKILEEHGIQQRDFSLLESPKYHLTDDEEIEILKEKIATLIERLGADKLIKIWDITYGKHLSTLYGHTYHVSSLIKLNEKQIASGSHDHMIKIWDVLSSECLKTYNAK